MEKSNINNNEEATRIRNARCKRVLPEPTASEEKFMISVRHSILGILRRLFTQQASSVNVCYLAPFYSEQSIF